MGSGAKQSGGLFRGRLGEATRTEKYMPRIGTQEIWGAPYWGLGIISPARSSRAGWSLSVDSEIPFENRLRFSTISYIQEVRSREPLFYTFHLICIALNL